ncbi:hypothetical protein QCA50_018663 [Cerrena zonata]|uniref:DUF6535 domain-containing protein n=1 Tax=Cerrena zonata TaxID=2478898 RepID=A0AAW0FAK5_9APHY
MEIPTSTVMSRNDYGRRGHIRPSTLAEDSKSTRIPNQLSKNNLRASQVSDSQGPQQIFTENLGSSKSANEKVQRVRLESEHIGWARLSDLYYKYDQARIQDVKEDIDTLLVFAGLFSAVVSAFAVDSYTTLQQQPEDSTNQILLQISSQLASFTISGSSVNSAASMFTPVSNFKPPSPSVRINTLWSLSLAISLITASLSILVKQWFHEFMAQNTMDPQQQVRIRVFRDQGLKRWRVFEIAAFLPLLLQLALLLFFIGLSEYLRELNKVVGWTTTIVMLGWLAVFVFTTFAPLSSSQCPYKTPVLKSVLFALRTKLLWLPKKVAAEDVRDIDSIARFSNNLPRILRFICRRVLVWVCHSLALEESIVRTAKASDLAILAYSENVLQGEQLQGTFNQCIQDCNFSDLSRYLRSLNGGPIRHFSWRPHPQSQEKDNKSVARMYLTMLGDKGSNYFAKLALDENTVFQDAHESLVFILRTACSPEFVDEMLLLALLRLVKSDESTATLAMASFYRVIAGFKSDGKRVWLGLLKRSLQDSSSSTVTNLVAATENMLQALWGLVSTETLSQKPYLKAFIQQAFLDDDVDPVVMTHVFSQFCILLGKSARRRYSVLLMKTMDGLVDILKRHRNEARSATEEFYLTNAFFTFQTLGVENAQLMSRIRDLHPNPIELGRRDMGFV